MENMVKENIGKSYDDVRTIRQTALKLEGDKRKLEEELKEWLSILEKNNIDMHGALVDADGYPRNDIDVYQVCVARHKIIYIRNDLRKIMEEIEKCLHLIHSKSDSSMEIDTDVGIISNIPIAKCVSISKGSPSDEAGLNVGDLITSFGSVNSSNFNCLADIYNIVQHSINQVIKVIILRNEVTVRINLKPHPWSGNGLLGCVILPIENVDR